MTEPSDILVVGAGPAGLTAALYLARFHLDVRVVDGGRSRAGSIPRTRNLAGFPGGLPGWELLARMRAQAAEFGVVVTEGFVERIEAGDGRFGARLADGWISARSVVLATGIVDNAPPVACGRHALAVARGLIRYCPICDGYEVTDRDVGVVGDGTHAVREAKFLRSFTDRLTLVTSGGRAALRHSSRVELEQLGIDVADGPVGPVRPGGDRIEVPTRVGDRAFDAIYPAMGFVARNDLAAELGASLNEDGTVAVDDHQRTTVPGLYAIGDVATGLNQIGHAVGAAGIAATTARNELAARRPAVRARFLPVGVDA